MTAKNTVQRPRYVLLIEDNVHHAELITELLDQHFAPVIIHTVDTFSDGMSFLSQSGYDLILSTGFIGDEGIKESVKDLVALSQGTPIIVITGRGDEALAARLTRKGISEYVVKSPKALEVLPRIIKKQLRRSKRVRSDVPSTSHAADSITSTIGEIAREVERFKHDIADVFGGMKPGLARAKLPDLEHIDKLQALLKHIRALTASTRHK